MRALTGYSNSEYPLLFTSNSQVSCSLARISRKMVDWFATITGEQIIKINDEAVPRIQRRQPHLYWLCLEVKPYVLS